MVLTCSASGCSSKPEKNGRISFHSFPKDEWRRKLWEKNINRENFTSSKYSKLCSNHFTAECFDPTKFGNVWLKKDAVPTIFNVQKLKNCNAKLEQNPSESCLMVNPIANDQPSTSADVGGKRKFYFGDFSENDITSLSKAKEIFTIARNNSKTSRRKIQTLIKKTNRMKKKITSLKQLLSESQNKSSFKESASNQHQVLEDVCKMPGCALGHCGDFCRKTKGTGVMYHTFPRDLKRQKLWTRDEVDMYSSYESSEDFCADEYLETELLGFNVNGEEATCSNSLQAPAVRQTSELFLNGRLQANLDSVSASSVQALPTGTGMYDNDPDHKTGRKGSLSSNVLMTDIKQEIIDSDLDSPTLEISENAANTPKGVKSSKCEAELFLNGGLLADLDSVTTSSKQAFSTGSRMHDNDPDHKTVGNVSLSSDVLLTDIKQEITDLYSPSLEISAGGAYMPRRVETSSTQCEAFENRTLDRPTILYPRRKVSKAVQTSPCASDASPSLTQIKLLQYRVRALKNTVSNRDSKIRKLHGMVRTTKREAKNSIKSAVNSEVRRILGKLFTENQINFLMKGKRCTSANWSEDTLNKCAALREVSGKAYVFMREKMGYPFPRVSTLKRWLELRKLKEQLPTPTAVLGANCVHANEITITEVFTMPYF